MNQIFSIYTKTMKKDLFLMIAIAVISILTFPFWLGFPLYFSIATLPLAAPVLFPLLSSCVLSLAFLYTNIHAAKEIYKNSQRTVLEWAIYLQIKTIRILFIPIFIGYIVILYLNR